MMSANAAVGRTKRQSASRAVGDEHAVEGVARPLEAERVADQRHQRNVVHREARIFHHGAGELGVADGNPPDLREGLDFEERDGRDSPWAVVALPETAAPAAGALLKTAVVEKKSASGIERDGGEPAVTLVQPITRQGEIVGFVQVGTAIRRLVPEFAESLSAHGGILTRAQGPPDAATVRGFSLFAPTAPALQPGLGGELQTLVGRFRVDEHSAVETKAPAPRPGARSRITAPTTRVWPVAERASVLVR